MPKRGKRDTFKLAQVSRVHPDSQHPEYHHRHHHEHRTIQLPIARGKNYVDDYELESISRVEDRLPVSSVLEIRAESPPIKIVQLASDIHSSELAIDHLGGSSSLVPVEKKSWTQPLVRSFVVSPNSHLLREISRIPTQTMVMKANVIQKSSWYRKKPWASLKNMKSINIPLVSLMSAVGIATCIIIILATLLSVKLKEQAISSNSFMSLACAPNCMMSLTPFPAPTKASWPFDGSLSDLNNIYSGSYTNPTSLTFTMGNIGQAISFYESQYVYSMTHFMNLSYQSWTIEAWMWITSLSTDDGIFGQCQSSSTTDKCLSLRIKNKRLYLSFNNDDVSGITVLSVSTNTWRHVAFVYDSTSMQQSIYLDGVLEATTGASGVATGPYKGTSGAVTIGWTNGSNYFNGRMDHLQVSSGAKTACQILNDATLTAYYSFDVSASYLDSSNNAIHGTSNLLLSVLGRVNQAYSFQYEYSYFQSAAFTAYSSKEPFSVSLWVKPFFVTGGTLIHLSTGNNDYSQSCFNLLGFSSAGQLVGRLFNSWATCCPPPFATTCPCQSTANVGGPIMMVNIWTHIVLTYSSANGMALYTNGTLQGVTQPVFSFPPTPNDYGNTRPYMIIGNPRRSGSIPGCLGGSPSISSATYQGLIDEFRIYSREITKTEICSLYHV